MKNIKIKKFLLGFALLISLTSMPLRSFAQAGGGEAFDPRLKAILMMAGYGLAGGGLLGTASLAFDTPGRSPFIGMSLGLYAGIIFGSYVVITHAVKKHRQENPQVPDEGYYPETPDSPYGQFGEESPQYWSPRLRMRDLHSGEVNGSKSDDFKRSFSNPVFYVPLINISF